MVHKAADQRNCWWALFKKKNILHKPHGSYRNKVTHSKSCGKKTTSHTCSNNKQSSNTYTRARPIFLSWPQKKNMTEVWPFMFASMCHYENSTEYSMPKNALAFGNGVIR